MISREEIALQLTLANTGNIDLITRRTNGSYTVDTLANNVNTFYNNIYDNIKTSENNTINV